jgi:hypothetical protein
MGRFISGRADKGNLEKWSRCASDNSFHHKSKAEKGGGAPSEQNANKGGFTARDDCCNCGPIGTYPGSNGDRKVNRTLARAC